MQKSYRNFYEWQTLLVVSFTDCLEVFLDHINSGWSNDRGYKSTCTAKDIFHNPVRFNPNLAMTSIRENIQIRTSAFEKIITSFINLWFEWIFEEHVIQLTPSLHLTHFLMKNISRFSTYDTSQKLHSIVSKTWWWRARRLAIFQGKTLTVWTWSRDICPNQWNCCFLH